VLSTNVCKADNTYMPNDSIYLMVACYDTNVTVCPVLANPDSVWFYRYFAGAVLESTKVTTAIRTGIVTLKVKASNTSSNYGYYSAWAIVYKLGKTGAKIWNWKVGADSVTAVKNEVRVISTDTLTTLLGNVNGSVASVTGEVRVNSIDTLTTLLGNVNGSVGSVTGAVGSVTAEVRVNSIDTITQVLNEVKVVSTDTITTILGNVNGSVASVTGEVRVNSIDTLTQILNEVKIVSTDTLTTLLGNVNGSVGSISGVTFPTNFGVLSISATTGLVDITQVAADKVWGTTVKALTDKAGFKLAADGLDLDTSFIDVQGTVHTTAIYQGAGDGWSQYLRPFGSANKDSAEIKNSAGTKIGTVYFKHVGSIIDSSRFEQW